MSGPIKIKQAEPSEAPAIRALIRAAYAKYVERIGKEPAPMQADVSALIARGEVWSLHVGQALRGSIRLTEVDGALEVNDLVVDPSAQGHGFGRRLMTFAEETARAKGLGAVTLYTNEKMVENLALYPRLGFVETRRGVNDGFNRVFFRKDLVQADSPVSDGRPGPEKRTNGAAAD